MLEPAHLIALGEAGAAGQLVRPAVAGMKASLLLAVAVISTGAFALPAMADDDDMTPARLERLDARAKELGYAINHVEAIRIAKTSGVVTVREIDLEDNHEWKVEGRDAEGREIEVELSARDGKVREVERD